MLLIDIACVAVGVAGFKPWERLKSYSTPQGHYHIEISRNKNGKHYIVVSQRGQEKPWPKEILKYPDNFHAWTIPVPPIDDLQDADVQKMINWPTFWPYEIKEDTTDEQLYEWLAEIKTKVEEWETRKPSWERAKELLNAFN